MRVVGGDFALHGPWIDSTYFASRRQKQWWRTFYLILPCHSIANEVYKANVFNTVYVVLISRYAAISKLKATWVLSRTYLPCVILNIDCVQHLLLTRESRMAQCSLYEYIAAVSQNEPSSISKNFTSRCPVNCWDYLSILELTDARALRT